MMLAIFIGIAIALSMLAVWSRYSSTFSSLMNRIFVCHQNQPIPPKYALDELKFQSS